MPRSEIELPHKIEYLSILDEGGKLDKELEPATHILGHGKK